MTSRPGVRLTKVGQRLARLPIDPRLGRMILEAERLGCLRDVLVIAAALSIQDPRERPEEQRAQADQQHARFKHESSDFLTWLNLWRHIKQQQRELSSSAFRRMCKREHLNYMRIREWQDYESQLRQVAKEMKLDVGHPSDTPDEDGIHQALLSGLLSHIGALEEREKGKPGERRPMREYLGARNARFAVFPGSVLKGRNPDFLMSAELVETSRLWARQNAAIKPEWAERLGAHLVKRTYSEPHWSRKRAAVMARERVTLYGVPLVADRLVQYGRIDAPLARELFIRHALVQREWDSRHRFLAENTRLLEEAEELEHRARRRDIVVDEETLFEFYDARVGADVVSGQHFDQWWKRARQKEPDLLTFDPEMLTHDTAGEVRAHDFPTQWHDSDEAGLTFPISYHFEPGAADDGLTIDVPVATLNRIDADDFSWLVPGLREELVTELIRSLPKNLRVAMVPAPNTAREFLAATPPGAEPLLDALERFARSTRSLVIDREAWDWSKVPTHLQPTYRVVTEEGAEAGRGKDLDALKEPLRPTFEQAMADVAADSGRHRDGPDGVDVRDDRGVLRPAPRRPRGARVPGPRRRGHDRRPAGPRHPRRGRRAPPARRTPPGAARARPTRAGRRRARRRGARPTAKLALVGSPYPSVGDLLDDVRAGIVGEVVDARPTVRTSEAAYDARRVGRRRARAVARAAPGATRARRDARAGRVAQTRRPRVLSRAGPPGPEPCSAALTDMRAQVGARLMAPGFVGEAGVRRLRDYPRYLAAVTHRRERLDGQVARDRQLKDQLSGLQDAWLHAVAALPEGQPVPQHLRDARWLLEEYRVSLFAQQLGTARRSATSGSAR